MRWYYRSLSSSISVKTAAMAYLTFLFTEAAVGPVVAFNPQWNKIFTGESINMTCEASNMTGEEEVTYHWFKDGDWIHSGKSLTISSAQKSNSGSYQCQTNPGDRSDSAILEVYNNYLILQVPPYAYEGDNLTLRCHHYPGYTAGQTIFYRNNAVIKDGGREDELQIVNVNITSSSKYKCTKQVYRHLLYYQHSDEAPISVQELFSIPTIRLSSHSVTVGDNVTLTCHTSLSPLRKTTVLEFAFKRDGKIIREFSSSNKYEITSAKQRHSGDYECEVKTSGEGIKKMSATLTILVNRTGEHELFNQSAIEVTSQPGMSHVIIAVSATSMVLIIIVTALILLYKARQNNQQPSKADSEAPDEIENIYTDLDTNTTWRDSSQNPHKTIVYNPATENPVIVC
ncbi:high affinity immunoglobulin gamma Fc receptor I-like isoform X2 [Hyla sarda]|uniref:high affinity immunoglobulin gamma Fc receptor I-like isoform X2 n=1 Tax=Hyla sarda TaxID=327740 RepID=UPI0024C3576F|nr:high affinity immunoglobulin gamma Fc receptor I-like isoform X2 [Hyla sarda]